MNGNVKESLQFLLLMSIMCQGCKMMESHGSRSPIKLLRVSRCLIKSFIFFNIVQPIDLIFCKMVEIIEQNIFNCADSLFRS